MKMMRMRRFFRSVYEDNADRKADDRRSIAGDIARYFANRIAQPLDRTLVRMHRDPSVPIVFVVGVPRSGTTLLYQLMCTHLDVGYVSNAMARWWMAPVAAARFRSPLGNELQGSALVSDLGRSDGPDGPHEFGWFWQFHLQHEDTDDLDASALSARDFGAAKAELEGLAGYFKRPLLLKALVHVPYKIAWLKAKLPQARFIWIHRDPVFVGQSILKSREDRFGDPNRWLSVRPRDVAQWRSRTPHEQVAHQIVDVTAAIDRAFASLGPNDGLHVEYDHLVGQPDTELRRIAEFCVAEVRTDTGLSTLQLDTRNQIRLSPEARRALSQALAGCQQPPASS
jgi:hypothetical protein